MYNVSQNTRRKKKVPETRLTKATVDTKGFVSEEGVGGVLYNKTNNLHQIVQSRICASQSGYCIVLI